MEPCKYEDRLSKFEEKIDKLNDRTLETHGDIRGLLAEFKAMNGTLQYTTREFNEHKKDSQHYRDKINILWSTVHTVKWAIGLLLGTGIVWKVVEAIAK